MKNKIGISLIIFFLFIHATNAENLSSDKNTSPNKAVIANGLSEEDLFKQTYREAHLLISTDLDTALALAKQLSGLAFQLKSPKHIGKAHWMMGYIYESKKSFKFAIEYYFSAYRAFRKTEDFGSCEVLLANAAKICLDHGAYEEAIEFYQRRLVYAKKLNNVSYARALFDLSLPQKFSSNFDNAVSSIIKAKELLNQNYQLADTLLMADLHNELGIIYRKMTVLNEDTSLLDSARIQYKKAIAINRSQLFKAKILNNIANTYLTEEKSDQALSELNTLISLNNALKSSNLSIALYNNLGVFHYQNGAFDSAFYYLNKSMDMQLNEISELVDFDQEHNIQTNTIPHFHIAYEYLNKLERIDPEKYTYPAFAILRKIDRMVTDQALIQAATTLIIVRTAHQILKEEYSRQVKSKSLKEYSLIVAFFVTLIVVFLLFVLRYRWTLITYKKKVKEHNVALLKLLMKN